MKSAYLALNCTQPEEEKETCMGNKLIRSFMSQKLNKPFIQLSNNCSKCPWGEY